MWWLLPMDVFSGIGIYQGWESSAAEPSVMLLPRALTNTSF